MDIKDQIQIGDTVNVNFNNAQFTLCHEATVLYMPLSEGDCWVFKDMENGTIHYVSEPCTISKKCEGE